MADEQPIREWFGPRHPRPTSPLETVTMNLSVEPMNAPSAASQDRVEVVTMEELPIPRIRLPPYFIRPMTPDFASWLIMFNLHSEVGSKVSDVPSLVTQVRPSSLLDDRFRTITTAKIRPNHISLDKLKSFIFREWKVDLDPIINQLGWVRSAPPASGRPDQYYVITSEVTLHSALSVLWNDSRRQPEQPPIILHLWTSIPPEAPLGNERRHLALTYRHKPKSKKPIPHPTRKSPSIEPVASPKTAIEIEAIIAGASSAVSDAQAASTVGDTEAASNIADTEAASIVGDTEAASIVGDTEAASDGSEVAVPGAPLPVDSQPHQQISTKTPPEKDGSNIEPDDGVGTPNVPKPGSDDEYVPDDDLGSPKDTDLDNDDNNNDPDVVEVSDNEDDFMPEVENTTQTPESSPEINLNDILAATEDDFDLEAPQRGDYEGDASFAEAWREYEERKQDNNLQSMFNDIDSPFTTHLNPESWAQACTFFSHDPERRQPDYICTIPFFARKLLPVQMFSVYIALRFHHGDTRHLFLALGMGLGKTTVSYCTHHTQHIYDTLWVRIKTKPELHVSQTNGDANNPAIVCPSQAEVFGRFGLHCPCYATSPGRHIKKRLGVTVILSPLALLDVWTHEFQECFNQAGQGTSQAIWTRDKTGLSNFGYHLARCHGPDSKGPTKEEWEMMWGTETVYDTADTEEEEVVKGAPQISCFEPRLDNGRVIILSTCESVVEKFLNRRENLRQHQWQVQRYNVKNKRGVGPTMEPRKNPEIKLSAPSSRCIVSAIYKDEVHLRTVYTVATVNTIRTRQFSNVSEEAHNAGPLYFVPYHEVTLNWLSGTPLVSGPSDLRPLVALMVRDLWVKDATLKRWMGKRLENLGKQWATNVRKNGINKGVTKSVLAQMPALVEALFLRFTPLSVFIDQPVVVVLDNIWGELKCEHPGEWQEFANKCASADHEAYAKQNLAAKTRFLAVPSNTLAMWTDNKPLNSYYRSRVIATFPFLGKMINPWTGEPFKLTNDEFRELTTSSEHKPARFIAGEDGDPFFDHLKEICESSGKLARWKQALQRFEPPGFRDAEGKHSRHIITSYFFVVAHVFRMWLLHIAKYSEENVLFVGGAMTATERTRTLAKFHVNLGSPVPAERQQPSRFLVATSSAISTGLTLAEAITVTFLEVDYHAHTMQQGFSRHCRQGNKNKKVYSWLMYNIGNPTEERIMSRNALRKQIEQVQVRSRKDLELDVDGDVDMEREGGDDA